MSETSKKTGRHEYTAARPRLPLPHPQETTMSDAKTWRTAGLHEMHRFNDRWLPDGRWCLEGDIIDGAVDAKDATGRVLLFASREEAEAAAPSVPPSLEYEIPIAPEKGGGCVQGSYRIIGPWRAVEHLARVEAPEYGWQD